MSKLKILLAENSNIVLEIEKRYLQDAGAVLFTAADSDGAMKIARRVSPSLIYLSFSLPGAGGVSCCRALKSDPKLSEIPVVMVCTAAGEEARLSREAGSDAVVAKPIDRREFLETGLSLIPRTAPIGERIVCRAVVACTLNADTFFGAIEDISINGMFVGSSREVAAGDRLTVKFVLPWTGAVPITCAAQVNWVNSSKRQRKDHLPPGFGVLFHGMDEEAIEQIKDYMHLIRTRLSC